MEVGTISVAKIWLSIGGREKPHGREKWSSLKDTGGVHHGVVLLRESSCSCVSQLWHSVAQKKGKKETNLVIFRFALQFFPFNYIPIYCESQ